LAKPTPAKGGALTLAERHVLWRQGILFWKLRPHQRSMYAAIIAALALWLVVHCARQIGKTFTLCLIALETALKKPGAKIRYVAPTEKSLRSYVHPNMQILLADCPPELRPTWDTQDSCYVFSNGSRIWLAGTEKEAIEKLRGPNADLILVDECGTMDNLRYVVNDVLVPQTFETDGRIVLIGTSPKTPGHDFAIMIREARAEGSYIRRTIDDNTHMTAATKERYFKAVGGRTSVTARREAFCELVVDEQFAVVPEFEAARDGIVREPPPCEWYHPLIAMDVGFEDLHAILYGYWDFEKAQLVVQDESFLRRARTDEIAKAVAEKEAALWPFMARENETGPWGTHTVDPGRKERRRVYRFTDVDPRLIADLSVLHGLQFNKVAKDDKEAQVNALRVAVRDGKLIIHPRCVTLYRHMSEAVWNKGRTEFDRTPECGHFDGVDALIYMWRMAPRQANPLPAAKFGREVLAPLWPEPTQHSEIAKAAALMFPRPRVRS
jgi:hypothetical protein